MSGSTTLERPALSPVEVMAHSPMPELRRLIVSTTECEVVLTGRVSTYYLKQMAQETVRCAVDGRKLINRVQVVGR